MVKYELIFFFSDLPSLGACGRWKRFPFSWTDFTQVRIVGCVWVPHLRLSCLENRPSRTHHGMDTSVYWTWVFWRYYYLQLQVFSFPEKLKSSSRSYSTKLCKQSFQKFSRFHIFRTRSGLAGQFGPGPPDCTTLCVYGNILLFRIPTEVTRWGHGSSWS